MQNYDIDDMLFGGTPLTKLIDIIGNANKSIVEAELEKFLSRVAVMETLLEKKGVDEKEIRSFGYENQDAIKNQVNSLALGITADILTQNE